MIDQFTYTLLKRILEFPWREDQFEYERLKKKYRSLYGGDDKSLNKLMSQLKALGYIDYNFEIDTGWHIKELTYTAIAEYEQAINESNKKSSIEYDNLTMQNQLLQRQLNSKEAEVQKLTITNLKLQNRSIRRQWFMLLIGIVAGFVTSNFGFFQKLFGSP